MWRGTTPVHSFTLPEGIGLDDFAVVYVTYSQGGKTILEKNKDKASSEKADSVLYSISTTRDLPDIWQLSNGSLSMVKT